jgi:hypothetical protein
MLSIYLCWSSWRSFSFWLSHQEPKCTPLPFVLHADPFALTWSFYFYLERSISYEAPTIFLGHI